MSIPAGRQLRITDTTLRDGSHAMAHQFTEEQVRATVHALDTAGVEVIEVTHGDGLGGSSFNYGFSRVDEIRLIAAGVEEATQAKIAVLLVPGIGTKDDLRHAREAGATVARIATHCTEADVSIQHFGLARDLGMETVGFLMMAHKTSPGEMARQARIMVDAGAECVYCVDSAGALVLGDAQERIQAMFAEVGHQAQIGFHGHQNLSLGVANSVLAYQHGARQVDGALCALGAGAGNSPTEVLAATFDHLGVQTGVDVGGVLAAAEEVVRPFLPRWPKMDRPAIVQGWAGVYSSFLLHAERAAERYGVPTHEILQRAGELGYVGGQEDMIIDIAVGLAQERDLADDHADPGERAGKRDKQPDGADDHKRAVIGTPGDHRGQRRRDHQGEQQGRDQRREDLARGVGTEHDPAPGQRGPGGQEARPRRREDGPGLDGGRGGHRGFSLTGQAASLLPVSCR